MAFVNHAVLVGSVRSENDIVLTHVAATNAIIFKYVVSVGVARTEIVNYVMYTIIAVTDGIISKHIVSVGGARNEI